MGQYRVGPSVTLRLLGHPTPSVSGDLVDHDFSATGPEGEHGPAREAALLATGALERVLPHPPVPDRLRRSPTETKE